LQAGRSGAAVVARGRNTADETPDCSWGGATRGRVGYAFDHWSAKLEYLHVDLGTANLPGFVSRTSALAVPATNEIVRAGVNFRF
jgi:hypothetical protein